MIGPANRQRVLVVDDEHFNRKVLIDLLKGDRDVMVAKNGAQALEKAREHLPDLILLDVVMPGMDGYDVLRQLKEDDRTREIAVIIVSALDSTMDEAKGLSMGALDYVTKPFHPAIVRARVRNILNVVSRRKMLEHMAHLDGLTEINNRRKFDETLAAEWRNGLRRGTPLGLALIDVDCFKLYNDTYGHALGDEVLCKVAETLLSCLRRPDDFAARYGGEEFAILLPDTDADGAWDVAESVRAAIEALGIDHENSLAKNIVTASIGSAVVMPTADGDPLDLIKAADAMLYCAKETGRNRVCRAQEVEVS